MEGVVLEDAEAGWLDMDVELAEGEAAGWPNAKDDDDVWPNTKVEPEAGAAEAGD